MTVPRSVQWNKFHRLTSPRVRRSSKLPDAGPVGSQHPFGSGIPAHAALSARLQGGLRFLRHRLPPVPSPSLAVGLPPRRGTWGLPSCRSRRTWAEWLGPMLRWDWSDVAAPQASGTVRPAYRFGPGLSAPLAGSPLRSFMWPFTCVQPETVLPRSDPASRLAGSGRCPRGFGRRIARSPARVGTPGHRRVRRDWLLSTLLERPFLVAPPARRGI